MDLVCAIVSPATCASLSNDWSADWSKGSIGLKEQGSATLKDALVDSVLGQLDEPLLFLQAADRRI